MKKPVILVLTLGLLLGAIVVGIWVIITRSDLWQNKAGKEALQPVSVMTVPDPLPYQQVTVPGTVVEGEGLPITCATGGLVQAVLVHPGQLIKKGDPILQLDQTQLRFAYQQLQAELSQAQVRLQHDLQKQLNTMDTQSLSETLTALDNTENLLDTAQSATPQKNATLSETDRQLDSIRAMLRNRLKQPPESDTPLNSSRTPSSYTIPAQAKVNGLIQKMKLFQAALAANTVTATKSGKLLSLNVLVGETLLPNALVGTLQGEDQYFIQASLPPSTIAHVQENDTVLIRFKSAQTNPKASGKVLLVQTAEEGKDATVMVMPISGRPLGLTANQSVDLTFQIPGEGSVWVPEETILSTDDGGYVAFIIQAHSNPPVALRQSVQVGQTMDGNIEILNGLNPGDTLVIEGANRLQNQQEVTIIGGQDFVSHSAP